MLAASDGLKEDKEIVIAAIGPNYYSAQCTGVKMRNDKNVALFSVRPNNSTIRYFSDEIRKDKEVLVEPEIDNYSEMLIL